MAYYYADIIEMKREAFACQLDVVVKDASESVRQKCS